MTARLAAVGTARAELLSQLGEVTYCKDGKTLLRTLAISGDDAPGLVVLGPSANPDGRTLDAVEVICGLAGLYGGTPPPTIVLVPEGREALLAETLAAGAADAVLSPYRDADLLARARARLRPEGLPLRPRRLDAGFMIQHLARPVTAGGGVMFGGRLVVAEISHGSLTRVLKAVRLKDASLAALKVLDPEVAIQDADLAGRFAREQRILLDIEHENLVPIRDAGTHAGLSYLDMDFIPGEVLQARLKREGLLPLREAVRLAIQVARGLQALHQREIVHRDVKPENVLIDAQGRALLCDFGLTKSQNDAGLTREGEILGTVAFIAPEVLTGSPPAQRADVYALGVTLFEMLTGKDAILPGPPDRMFRAAVMGEAQQQAMRELPEAVRPVVTRMLAVDPGDRYDRIPDLIADLERALG